MRYAQGGTQVYCPHCEKVTICKVVSPSSQGYEGGQRFYKSNHEDVNWFRRVRVCQSCEENFPTAELDEGFVDELVELRDALCDIKLNAESYMRESTSASKSLAKLSNSMKVLRALEIYKRT